MSLSDSSECSELSYDEVYSLDDLLQMKIIGNKVANWIKQNPLPEDDPLLLLEYRDPNVANRGNEIRLALIANGATEITPTVFQFATNDSVFEAQHNMMNTHTWAFYNSSPMLMVHRINQPGQVVPLPQAETISTKLVHSYSASKFNVDKKFCFFRIM
uniref:Uncharacterized protein n=1 Tax=Panagrolaimus superbus TaxID=310955 RepID=A0A914XX70_9BILA